MTVEDWTAEVKVVLTLWIMEGQLQRLDFRGSKLKVRDIIYFSRTPSLKKNSPKMLNFWIFYL